MKIGTNFKFKILNFREGGFTIIEMIIAIALVSFGIIIVYGTFSSTVVSTYNASARFTASYLGQEGLEIIRNIRDNNFINIANDPDNPSLTWDIGLRGTPCDVGCMVDYKTKVYAQFLPYDDSAFLGLNQEGFYSYDIGATPTVFKRKINISEVLGISDVLHIDVIVTWSYNGQSFSFRSNEDLYNWY